LRRTGNTILIRVRKKDVFDDGNANLDSPDYYTWQEICIGERASICVRLTSFQNLAACQEKGTFVGNVLPSLLQPMALRMVLPGDLEWVSDGCL
jgi:hypothetical protein